MMIHENRSVRVDRNEEQAEERRRSHAVSDCCDVTSIT